MTLADLRSYCNTFLLYKAYRCGLRFILDHNNGHSVTTGGGMFHLPGLALPGGGDPFEDFDVVSEVALDPVGLPPTHALFGGARDDLLAWSDSVWIDIGLNMEPDDPPPPRRGGG